MYNKVKYLIYVSFILFFILMFTAIQNRSSQVAEQRAQEKFQKELMEKTEKYQKMADEQNKKQRQENTEQKEDYSSSFVPAVQQPQQENTLQRTDDSQNATGTVVDNNEETIKNTSQEKLYFAADKTEAVGYVLCKRFDFEGNNYAVVAVDDTQYVSEYSKYLNRKFYIYKQNGQNLERVHYLFEKSVDKSDKSLPDVLVEVHKYDVKITYNIKPPVNRTVSQSILINIGYQYKDVPVLTLSSDVSSASDIQQSEGDNSINIGNEPQN